MLRSHWSKSTVVNKQATGKVKSSFRKQKRRRSAAQRSKTQSAHRGDTGKIWESSENQIIHNSEICIEYEQNVGPENGGQR